MKRFFFWLVMVCGGGALAWSVYAIEIGGLENVVQTIRNVVITSDGAVAKTDKSNVIMNINDPQGNNANRIYIKKGAFKDRTIVKEDIDWESIFSGNNYFSCAHKGEGYALQKMDYPNDATCVYVGDYRQPTDPQDKKGAIYYASGVAVGVLGDAARARGLTGVLDADFHQMEKTFPGLSEDKNKAQFLVKDRLSPKGAIIVGKKDKYMALTSDNGAAVLDVVSNISGQKPQLVMGADAGVSIGGDVLMDSAKLSVHGNVHADKTLEIHHPTKGSMKTSVSSDKTTITLTNKNFFIGGGVKDANATKLSHRGSVAHAWSWSDAGLVVGSASSSSTPHAPLTVNGGLSVRGQGEKGGIGIGGFVGVVDIKSAGCRVASVDNTGKVVMKAVAGCCIEKPGKWSSCSGGKSYRAFSYIDGAGNPVAASSCSSSRSREEATCWDASCGTAVSESHTTEPTTNLCSPGTDYGMSMTNGKWQWTCFGSSKGGGDEQCTATKKEVPTYDIYTCQDSGTWSAPTTNQTNIRGITQYGRGPYNPSTKVYVAAGATKPSDGTCTKKAAPVVPTTYDIYTCQDSGTWNKTSTGVTSTAGSSRYRTSQEYNPASKVHIAANSKAPLTATCSPAAGYYCVPQNPYKITGESFDVLKHSSKLCQNGARIPFTEKFLRGSYVCRHPDNGQSSCRVKCSTGKKLIHDKLDKPKEIGGYNYLKCVSDVITYEWVEGKWNSCNSPSSNGQCLGSYVATTSSGRPYEVSCLGFSKSNCQSNRNCAWRSGVFRARDVYCKNSKNESTSHSNCTDTKPDEFQTCGACGSNNGKELSSKPTTNLCSSGTKSTVRGSGPWRWTCNAAGGNASCRAEAVSVPDPTGVVHFSHVYEVCQDWDSSCNYENAGWAMTVQDIDKNLKKGVTYETLTRKKNSSVWVKGFDINLQTIDNHRLAAYPQGNHYYVHHFDDNDISNIMNDTSGLFDVELKVRAKFNGSHSNWIKSTMRSSEYDHFQEGND